MECLSDKSNLIRPRLWADGEPAVKIRHAAEIDPTAKSGTS